MSHPLEPISSEQPSDDLIAVSSIHSPVPSFFMVVDMLGFSQMIENLSGDEQTKRIMDWIELVEASRLKTAVNEIQLISDTLFAREEDSVDGLARLLTLAQLLLERGIGRSFPLRGAVVHGDVAWGTLTYGDAVIKAHQIERSLDWIGIACAPGLPGLDEMWDWDLVTAYPVPKKSGKTQIMPAISWKVPTANELLHNVLGNGLIAEKEAVGWEIVSKVERTIQFGIHLRIGKAHGWDPKYYRGWFPMHSIEQLLKTGE